MHDHSTKNHSQTNTTLIYFFICTRPYDQKFVSSLIYLFYLYTTIRPKIRVLIVFFLFAHGHSTKLYNLFSFIYFILPLLTTIRPKIRVIINLFFSFVHDHSTKVRGHSYSLIYFVLNCTNNSFALKLLYFVRYNHILIFRTLYSWKYCSYISYAISMTIWSLCQVQRL